MTDIKTLELSIESAKESVELGKQLERLERNKDFQELIGGQLFENYSQTLVHLLSDPARQSEAEREDIIKDMEMIGRFRQFLFSIHQKAHLAEKSIADSQEAIDELRAYGEDE